MPEPATPEPTTNPAIQVYQFHVLLLQISPAIWRRFLVRSDSSIVDLHYTLQIIMGWEDLHLHRFVHHGKEYGITKPGGTWFDADPTQILLSDLHLRLKERFLYEYDFRDFWQHQLRLERVLPFDPTKSYPVCLAGAWQAPPEGCGGPWQYMERRQYAPWRIAERLSEVLEDPEEDIYEHLAELRELVYWQQANKFDRHSVNRQLRHYADDPAQWQCSQQEVLIII